MFSAKSLQILQEEFVSGASESDHSGHGSNSSHSDSVSSDFSATSAAEFNHGLLLSALKAIHSELQRLILGRRKSHHILLGLLAKQQKMDLVLEAIQSDNQRFELLLKAMQSENGRLKSGRATASASQSEPCRRFA